MKKYYTFTIKTLAPVHIASGKKINKLEYVYSHESRMVYIMNMVELSNFFVRRKLMDVFIDRIQRGNEQFSLAMFLKEKAVMESEYKKFAAYSYKNDNISVEPNQMEINEFVKDAYGAPYVPGSSIKGALRTALEYDEIMRNYDKDNYSELSQNISDAIRNKDNLEDYNKKINGILKDYNRELNTKVFHTLERKKKYNQETKKEKVDKKDILNDCQAGLFISDSRPLSNESLVLCEKTDLQIDGNTHSINLLRECLCPGTDIVFDVVIDTDLCPYDAKDIIDSLKYFYEDYDFVFRSKFIDKANGAVFEPLKNNDEGYIYLGGGTGFPLKTVMYSLYKDSEEAADLISIILNQNFKSAEHKLFTERERVSPKVLKCTKYQDKLYEMGKCSISFKEKNI